MVDRIDVNTSKVNDKIKSNFFKFSTDSFLAQTCVRECFPEGTVIFFYNQRNAKRSYNNFDVETTSKRQVRRNLIENLRRVSSISTKISIFFDLRFDIDSTTYFSLGKNKKSKIKS